MKSRWVASRPTNHCTIARNTAGPMKPSSVRVRRVPPGASAISKVQVPPNGRVSLASTRYAAAQAVRAEVRRQAREGRPTP